jgi:uncharacterized membrane protein YhaH (DUF805 family)
VPKSTGRYFKWFYLSLRGRIGRQAYWLFFIVPSVLLGVFLGIAQSVLSISDESIQRFFIVTAPLIIWIGIAVSVKRWHDTGRSGWWMLLSLIPFANFAVTIVLGSLRGETGSNEYGNDPHRAEAGIATSASQGEIR